MADKRKKVSSTGLVNSTKQQLPTHEVITRSLVMTAGKNATPKEIKEQIEQFTVKAVQSNAVIEQIGNTVFAHVEQPDNKDKKTVVGTLLNLDIASNMFKSVRKYLQMLQAAGVGRWIIGVDDRKYVPMAKAVMKKLGSEGYSAKFLAVKSSENKIKYYILMFNIPRKQLNVRD